MAVEKSSPITLKNLFRRFNGKISLTLFLVVAETAVDLLFPLFIGYAINGLLTGRMSGVVNLGLLGVAALAVGSSRRFYDTRAYAAVYTTISGEMVAREQAKGSDISTTSARAGLLTEFVEFLENSLPMIVNSLIGLAGVLAILWGLNTAVFWASLALLGLMTLVYLFSSKWNFRYNQAYNDALEEQVNTLSTRDTAVINSYFRRVMRWNIKLSDLETVNYALIWLGIIALFVYAPVAVIDDGVTDYGRVFAVLMYVFQFVESVITLPYFIQQIIRLQEISGRLNEA